MTHQAIGFDCRMPELDFDSLDLPGTGTGTLSIAVAGVSRQGGARNKQQPRHQTPRPNADPVAGTPTRTGLA